MNNIVLTEGAASQKIVLRMNRGGEIFGSVLDMDGRPIAGTRILCDDWANANYRSTWTDEDGNYSLTGLAEGRYVITLSSGNLNLDRGNYMALADEGLESKNATLGKGQRLRVDFCESDQAKATIAGTVRQGGEPVEGSVVSVVTEGKTLLGQGPPGTHVASTAKDGTFRITNLSPGRALLQVSKVGGPFGDTMSGQVCEIVLKESGTTNVSIDLPTGEIHGVVQDAATCEPLAGVAVYASLHQTSSERLVLAAFAKNYACKTRTKHDGGFALTGLEAGRYTVTAGGPDPLGATNADHALARSSNIDVRDGQKVVIDPLLMPHAAIIEGIVEDSAGQPVSDVSIFLRQAGSDDDFIQRLALVRTDASGYFVYHGVPQGCYDVVCQGASWGQTIQRGVNAIPAQRTNIRVTIAQGTTVFLVIKEVPRTGLSDLDIELLGSEGRVPLGLSDISDMAGVMFQIREPGVYGLGTFAPGEYRVRGTCAGKEFSKAFTLRGEKELRVEVSIE
ncbi:MAG: carboxypeptidase-like regulatory domain-containing protein [Planctomycetota bacterium]